MDCFTCGVSYPQGLNIFMLNSYEHEICSDHKFY